MLVYIKFAGVLNDKVVLRFGFVFFLNLKPPKKHQIGNILPCI